jgi:hypothetical protein
MKPASERRRRRNRKEMVDAELQMKGDPNSPCQKLTGVFKAEKKCNEHVLVAGKR